MLTMDSLFARQEGTEAPLAFHSQIVVLAGQRCREQAAQYVPKAVPLILPSNRPQLPHLVFTQGQSMNDVLVKCE